MLEAAAIYLNSAHGVSSDLGLTGRKGPSIFPSTSLAVRLQIKPADGLAVRAAVLDGVPNDPDRPARTVVRLGKADGALLAGEVEASLAGVRLLLGHWRYTAAFERVDGSVGKANAGTYVRVELPLDRAATNDQGVHAFARIGTSNGRINPFNRFLYLRITSMGTSRNGAKMSRASLLQTTPRHPFS